MHTAQKITQKNGSFVSIAALIGLAALSSCAGSGARVDRDPKVDFAAYKTFGWFQPAPMPAPQAPPPGPQLGVPPPPSQPSGAPPAGAPPPAPPQSQSNDIASISGQRTHAAIADAFAKKGYSEVNASPDFLVSYNVNVIERARESPVRIGIGAGRSSGNAGGSVGVSLPVGSRTEHVAILTIDVIDPKRNAQVWTGTYQGKINNDHLNDDNTQLWVKYTLEKFPKQGSK